MAVEMSVTRFYTSLLVPVTLRPVAAARVGPSLARSPRHDVWSVGRVVAAIGCGSVRDGDEASSATR